MKLSEYFIPTLKEIPKDAEAMSHIVMLRSGMIRKLASGYYSYLPLGLKVLNKAKKIIREEMTKVGAHELLMPAVHPKEIWERSGRYETMDEILLKVHKGDHEYVLGPTHEEIITELATAYINSYKDLPVMLYQIQNKFRHEARPRFGVIRSREFTMKDAYSFHASQECLDKTYQEMVEAYKRIFSRCGLTFVAVEADTGAMGGRASHEFMVPISFGEDHILLCESCGYQASVEVAPCKPKGVEATHDKEEIEMIETPNTESIDDVAEFLHTPSEQCIKAMMYETDEGEFIMCLVRGNHEVCEPKLAKALGVSKIEMADPEGLGAVAGFAGPIGLNSDVKIVADGSLKDIENNFVIGANKKGFHFRNANWTDFDTPEFYDIRKIETGDPCPSCDKPITVQTSLEIGHVFKLGTKYTNAFDASILDANGKPTEVIMGCYGIGVNRIVASAIEQSFDEESGMVWPFSLAPFSVMIVTANQSSEPVVQAASELYEKLSEAGVEVLYDDRNDRMGKKLNDAELIGCPLVVIIGDRGLKESKVELRNRVKKENQDVLLAEIQDVIQNILSEEEVCQTQ